MDGDDVVVGAIISFFVIVMPLLIMLILSVLPMILSTDDEYGNGCLSIMAGFIGFVTYTIVNLSKLHNPLSGFDIIYHELWFDWRAFIAGILIGFVLVSSWERIVRLKIDRLAGAFVSFGGLWMLFNYLFEAKIRVTVLFISLGIALGMLLGRSDMAGGFGGGDRSDRDTLQFLRRW